MDAFPFFADLLNYWPQIVRGLRDTILLSVVITATGLIGTPRAPYYVAKGDLPAPSVPGHLGQSPHRHACRTAAY